MRLFIIIVTGLFIVAASMSFRSKDDIGWQLFELNCRSCHLPNESAGFGPSFQNIRKDYGLNWTISFLRDQYKMMKQKDTRTLFSYYLFNKSIHVNFPVLEKNAIIKILDYVDSLPVDSTQYEYRRTPNVEKFKFIKKKLLSDPIPKTRYTESVYEDGIMDYGRDKIDSVITESKRHASKRATNKKQ